MIKKLKLLIEKQGFIVKKDGSIIEKSSRQKMGNQKDTQTILKVLNLATYDYLDSRKEKFEKSQLSCSAHDFLDIDRDIYTLWSAREYLPRDICIKILIKKDAKQFNDFN